ncbi:MAG: DMT family transporter [Dinoroseobacter sp.]|nr:DMT family transporter [Dinoroseobacter sp.]
MSRANLNGIFLALLAFGLFSIHDVIVKILGANYAPFQIVFFSVLFGFPLATLMLMRDATDGNLRPKHPMWTALRTASAVMTGVSAFYAFTNLPLAQVYAIVFATPLFITILSIPILGETVRFRRWAAVVAGMIGVIIVLRPGQTDLTLAHLAALSCAVFGALASVIVRKIGREERSIVLMLYPMMANFVLMLALLPFVYVPVPLTHMAGFATMALLAFAAMLCLISAYRKAEAALIAPMQYSQIIWAVAFGFLLFDEVPDRETGIGVAVIIMSGLYIVFRESRGTGSVNQPVLRTRSRAATPSTPRIGPQLDPKERDRSVSKPDELS